MKRIIEFDVDATPGELAKDFWELDSEDQARFFNALAKHASEGFCLQMSWVATSEALDPEGRAAMVAIGEHAGFGE